MLGSQRLSSDIKVLFDPFSFKKRTACRKSLAEFRVHDSLPPPSGRRRPLLGLGLPKGQPNAIEERKRIDISQALDMLVKYLRRENQCNRFSGGTRFPPRGIAARPTLQTGRWPVCLTLRRRKKLFARSVRRICAPLAHG